MSDEKRPENKYELAACYIMREVRHGKRTQEEAVEELSAIQEAMIMDGEDVLLEMLVESYGPDGLEYLRPINDKQKGSKSRD